MSDEPVPVRYSPVSGTLQQPALPLFTPDDVELLASAARFQMNTGRFADLDELASLRSRLQQWIDQQHEPRIERGWIKPGDPDYVPSSAVRGLFKDFPVIDETNLSEG